MKPPVGINTITSNPSRQERIASENQESDSRTTVLFTSEFFVSKPTFYTIKKQQTICEVHQLSPLCFGPSPCHPSFSS